MSQPATARLKVSPPLGRMPTLQFVLPAELQIDHAYQRSIDAADSQTLIRRIAQHWNWDLCQPLVVSRRSDGALFVIDGQHRLAASRLRSDIHQLPCVIVNYAASADEAASFVHLNQQRRPLKKHEIFRAAVASGDPQSLAIAAAITAAGLSIAKATNPTCWKPGELLNIGGIEASWRQHGARATTVALAALSQGLAGSVMSYAGSIFPGIAAIVAAELSRPPPAVEAFVDDLWPLLIEMIAGASQKQWRKEIMLARSGNENLNFSRASEVIFLATWGELLGELLGEDEDVAA